MPRIFDNIDLELLPTLRESVAIGHCADFCVGYFNLRGWRHLADLVESWRGEDGSCCRLLVGMPVDQLKEVRDTYSLLKESSLLDNTTAVRLRRQMARIFREQLTYGAPTEADEIGLRVLSRQLRARKLVVRLHLRFPLHAKLYLTHRVDPNNPTTAFLGSSNLTFSGLRGQGELNVDVLDHDATAKLQRWFEDRWADRLTLDITDELAEIVDQSWITPRDPYTIYIKMAYHLSREARAGISSFEVPRIFGGKLFEFQAAAVKIAAHHLLKRDGVLLGDVVGLGKTLMASAVAKILRDQEDIRPLVICPPNLVGMWQKYSDTYELDAKVMSLGKVIDELPDLRIHRLVIVDESQNLRNRDSSRYKAIKKYIEDNGSRVILLSATPYNKGYQDISSQLRLFLGEDQNLGIRPEAYIRSFDDGEIGFSTTHQCPIHCVRAFEHSPFQEDWQQLMRQFMVRRTRTFIKNHYATKDPENGRYYLSLLGGGRAYFPDRMPHTVRFEFDERDSNDPYAKLFSTRIVDIINRLDLARYGLGNYVRPDASEFANAQELKTIGDLSRAGKRLMGFCRTNLYKRLESGGDAFLLSIRRHILRNYLFLHALDNGLPLPIGTQEPWMLDTASSDLDDTGETAPDADVSEGETAPIDIPFDPTNLFPSLDVQPMLQAEADRPSPADLISGKLKAHAAAEYENLRERFKKRFDWIRPTLFEDRLIESLRRDAEALTEILAEAHPWRPERDRKLSALLQLVTSQHPNEKVLVFTQFADTATYLAEQLRRANVDKLAYVTGSTKNLTTIAQRFSPVSNDARTRVRPEDEIRVLIATDVLSEGQNLQDAHVIVNYDLPWAIIRLAQRAGRVDRIGQQSETIDCYSFVPMDGVERIIALRAKIRSRLKENSEVIGTDEAYFDDDGNDSSLQDIYTEKSGILDGSEDEREVDLQSRAYQIFKDAIDADPGLEARIEAMPDVVYSAKAGHLADHQDGVLVYVRTADDADSLAYVGQDGRPITEDQAKILDLAACDPQTPGLPRAANHHKLVSEGVSHLVERERGTGGQLGRPSGARYRAYMALRRHLEANEASLLVPPEMQRALEQILKFPLKRPATDAINQLLRRRGSDEAVSELVYDLYVDQKLCHVEEDEVDDDPRIICSLGVRA